MTTGASIAPTCVAVVAVAAIFVVSRTGIISANVDAGGDVCSTAGGCFSSEFGDSVLFDAGGDVCLRAGGCFSSEFGDSVLFDALVFVWVISVEEVGARGSREGGGGLLFLFA